MKGYSCNCTRTLLGNPLLPLEYQSYHRQVLRRSSNVAVVDIGSQWDFPDLAVRCFGDIGLSKGAKDCVFNFSTKTSYLTSSAGLRQGVFTHSALGIMVVTIPSLEEEAEAGDVGYGELTVGGRAYTGFGVVRRRIVRFLPSFSLAWCCVYIDITARF